MRSSGPQARNPAPPKHALVAPEQAQIHRQSDRQKIGEKSGNLFHDKHLSTTLNRQILRQPETVVPLHCLLQIGDVMALGAFRGPVGGRGERAGQSVLAAPLSRKPLTTDAAHGKLCFGVQLHALRHYYPALWPAPDAEKVDDR